MDRMLDLQDVLAQLPDDPTANALRDVHVEMHLQLDRISHDLRSEYLDSLQDLALASVETGSRVASLERNPPRFMNFAPPGVTDVSEGSSLLPDEDLPKVIYDLEYDTATGKLKYKARRERHVMGSLTQRVAVEDGAWQELTLEDPRLPDGTAAGQLLMWSGEAWQPFGQGEAGEFLVSLGAGEIPGWSDDVASAGHDHDDLYALIGHSHAYTMRNWYYGDNAGNFDMLRYGPLPGTPEIVDWHAFMPDDVDLQGWFSGSGAADADAPWQLLVQVPVDQGVGLGFKYEGTRKGIVDVLEQAVYGLDSSPRGILAWSPDNKLFVSQVPGTTTEGGYALLGVKAVDGVVTALPWLHVPTDDQPGLVPQLPVEKAGKYLDGNGQWADLAVSADPNHAAVHLGYWSEDEVPVWVPGDIAEYSGGTLPGWVPRKPESGAATKYLRADGQWAVPPFWYPGTSGNDGDVLTLVGEGFDKDILWQAPVSGVPDEAADTDFPQVLAIGATEADPAFVSLWDTIVQEESESTLVSDKALMVWDAGAGKMKGRRPSISPSILWWDDELKGATPPTSGLYALAMHQDTEGNNSLEWLERANTVRDGLMPQFPPLEDRETHFLRGDGQWAEPDGVADETVPGNPGNGTTLGSAAEGTEAALSTTWVANASTPLDMWVVSRVVYNHAGNRVLYKMMRRMRFTQFGRLYSVGAETRVDVDAAVSIWG